MPQIVRFCKTADGIRIAYATVGSGPPLVAPPPWVGHLEWAWEEPRIRAFYEALAENHTVIRYDKHGCGLSDRNRTDFSLESELRQLEAVVDDLKLKRFALFSASYSGPVASAYAHINPERVSHLILYGTYARWPSAEHGTDFRQALMAMIIAHWGLGARTIANLVLPDANAESIRWLDRFQRESATAEMAARLYSLAFDLDVADLLPRLRVPTLVMHRREDLAMPFSAGRELAALIPGANLVVLEGQSHPPYFGDSESVLRATTEFLGIRPGLDTGSAAGRPVLPAGSAGSAGDANSMRHRGDFWEITFRSATFVVRDAKGIGHIATMLQSPDREFHVLEFSRAEAAGSEPAGSSIRGLNDEELDRLGLRKTNLDGDAGDILDSEAKAAYKRRLDELRAELEEARAISDIGRAEKVETEIEFLIRELTGAVGLGGRNRKAASNVERARVKVGKAIRSAIARIGRANQNLGKHLSATIKTGTFCSYRPDSRDPIVWHI